MCVCVQIFMKYGRQRWKLRGRMEINAKQVWDSEEIVFQPLINEFLSVKVCQGPFLSFGLGQWTTRCKSAPQQFEYESHFFII